MAGEIVIRQAGAADARAIAEIDKASFSVPWSEESYVKEFTENKLAYYLVAEIDGRAVGFCGMWCIFDEGHITNVAVHPDYRRRHVATELLRALIRNSIQMSIFSHTLEVRATNYAAQNLYAAFGFRPDGVRKAYYEDNHEDAIIMWRITTSEEI